MSKLQHEFKHARDFGITEANWNLSIGKAYQQAIKHHIQTATDIFKSTYRGQDVYVYYSSKTGVGAYVGLKGIYVGGWKFSEKQVDFHIKNGVRLK